MKKSKVPFEWNKVTPLSKYLALTLVVVLPFIGFILGVNYEKQIYIPATKVDQTSKPTDLLNPSPTLSALSTVYKNNYFKLTVLPGWIVKETNRGTAVNITKGNYILYINSQKLQASGVQGGRFAEIAMGAPSADAVIKVQPSSECGSAVKNQVKSGVSQVDLFVGPTDKTEWCNIPRDNTRWYFSYITTQNGGYINYYNETKSSLGWVITMAYDTTDPNSLPVKGSLALNKAMSEMTSMVASLELGQQSLQ